jgi:hypothetical protein
MIKRICLQGSGFEEWVYLDKEDMRLGLCDLHEPDWTGTEIDSNGKELRTRDILYFNHLKKYANMGNWGYQELTSKEEEIA